MGNVVLFPFGGGGRRCDDDNRRAATAVQAGGTFRGTYRSMKCVEWKYDMQDKSARTCTCEGRLL